MLPLRDNAPTRTTPYVTVWLIAANALVWFWELSSPGVDVHVFRDGFYPCALHGPCAVGLQPLPWWESLFTGMFMHASWEHILGNMLFLWIFGNNVEDVMGRLRFAAFYLTSGVAAALTQAAVTLHWSGVSAASIPTVGASGAIAGVLGAYLVLLPGARVLTLLFGFLPWRLSAGFFLGFWFVFQLWEGDFSLTHPGAGGGVAFAAHVGGFLYGALTVRVFQVRQPLRPR